MLKKRDSSRKQEGNKYHFDFFVRVPAFWCLANAKCEATQLTRPE